MLLFLATGCDKQNLSTEPNQLIGTWNAQSNTDGLYNRWTFDKEYLQKANDSLNVCKQAISQSYKYWIEKDVLVVRYVGITNGFILIPDERYRLYSVSSRNITLEFPKGQRMEFEKCP